MNMNKFIKFQYLAILAFLFSAMQMAFVSCSDEPDSEYIYSFQGEMAKDYLDNRTDKFSEFITVLQRAKVYDLLGTYGSYTLFAPTNTAFENYLSSRGLSSVAELTDKDCDTIAYTHIVKQEFFTTDFPNGTYPASNMLDRYLTITGVADSVSVPGEVVLQFYINNLSRLEVYDDSVRNGVVHVVDKVISSSNDVVADMLYKDSTATIFFEALHATKLDLLMTEYKDESYPMPDPDSVDIGIAVKTATEYDIVYYPKVRYYKYTAFVEQDSVYNKYGIYNLDDLKEYAAQIYDVVYPEDADVEDITDRRNSLNRFISYHLLDRLANYNDLTVDGELFKNNFKHKLWDVAEWYETMMPHSIMKISHPTVGDKGTGDLGIFINRRGVGRKPDNRGVFIPGARIIPPSEANADQSALNGVYHYIDDIIHYGQQTQEEVLNERMRIDATTLSPDFMSSGARGHYANSGPFSNKYALWSSSTDPAVNGTHAIGFKVGYVKNFTFQNPNTHIHVRNRFLSFWSYMGDELTISGNYDFTFKLPPVPAGTYEFRIGTCIDFPGRGVIQVYIQEGENGPLMPCGIPFDMRMNSASLGWQSDATLSDEEAIAAFDKSFHSRGWMKGSDAYCISDANNATRGSAFRDLNNTLRKVVTQFQSDGKTDYYIRIQQKLESDNSEFAFDFIELVPSSVYSSELYPEDRH